MAFSRETILGWLRAPLDPRYPGWLFERAAPRMADILFRRYCIEPQETLAGIGASWGVTRESIRAAEAKGVRKLRHPARAPLVRACVECPPRLYAAIFGVPKPSAGTDG